MTIATTRSYQGHLAQHTNSLIFDGTHPRGVTEMPEAIADMIEKCEKQTLRELQGQ